MALLSSRSNGRDYAKGALSHTWNLTQRVPLKAKWSYRTPRQVPCLMGEYMGNETYLNQCNPSVSMQTHQTQDNYCGLWMAEIRSHHFGAMGNHCLLVFIGGHRARVSHVVQDFVHPQSRGPSLSVFPTSVARASLARAPLGSKMYMRLFV